MSDNDDIEVDSDVSMTFSYPYCCYLASLAQLAPQLALATDTNKLETCAFLSVLAILIGILAIYAYDAAGLR